MEDDLPSIVCIQFVLTEAQPKGPVLVGLPQISAETKEKALAKIKQTLIESVRLGRCSAEDMVHIQWSSGEQIRLSYVREEIA